MDKRIYKNAIYGELSKISKALANPNRLEIMDLLSQREFTVEEIASETNSTIANTSQHLQTLKTARLVSTRRSGHYINYKLSDIRVFELWKTLREFGFERNAELQKIVNDYRKDKGALESFSLNDLVKNDEMNNYIFLDVRSKEDFDKGSIPNAISIPIDELNERIKELPKNKKVVVYCRGPFCVFADDALTILRKNDIDSVRLEEGFPDWELIKKGLEI